MRANQVTVNVPRRRIMLAAGCAMLSGVPSIALSQSLVSSRGGYRFLPGGQVFAGGAVANEGYAMVHAMLKPWLSLQDAYAFIERYLKSQSLTIHALCGMELRLPRQLSFDEFRLFNAPYVEQLVKWGLLVEGRNPISRTNVAPSIDPPEFPSVHAFSFVMPSKESRTPNFVMSGMTEIGPGGQIIANDDVTDTGMQQKVKFVVEAVTKRLGELGVSFNDATHIEFYAARSVENLLTQWIAPATDMGSRQGLRWHVGRPPVQGVEIELEARAVTREIVLSQFTS